MPASPSSPHAHAPGRIPALDGLRGIAIGLVLINHLPRDLALLGNGFYHAPYNYLFHAAEHPLAYPAWQLALLLLFHAGWTGVDLFFVLSGFLITGILMRLRDGGATFGHYFAQFYRRRALRIWPLYLTFLALMFHILPVLGIDLLQPATHAAQAWFWLHLMNFYVWLRNWPEAGLSHLWSLAIEEQFYFVWPMLIWRCPARRRLQLMLGLALLAPLLRGLLYARTGNATLIYVMPFTRMDTLCLGAALAVWHQRGDAPAALFRACARTLAITLAFCLGLLLLLFFHSGVLPAWTLPFQIGAYSVIALAAACAVALALASRPREIVHRALTWPPLVWLGTYSYCIYILHPALDHAARGWGWHPSAWSAPPINRFICLLLYSIVMGAVTCGLAWLSWHLMEKHFLRLKELPWRKQARAPQAETP